MNYFFRKQDEAKELINCFKGRRNQTADNRQYSEVIRKFALTLSIYSPKAYRYVREKFGSQLPHPSTLAKWYSQSDCCGEPGILSEAIKTLEKLAKVSKEQNKPLLGSLAFDEVAIRRHVQYDHQKKQWYGYITKGKPGADGKLPVANNALVFMLTILNFCVSIPIAYYNITTLDGNEKKNLLLDIMTTLHDVGVTVTNVTFDGLKSNQTACELLGASFDPHKPIPFFLHPVSKHKVYVILDPCHMLKLIRNALGDLSRIVDPSRGAIRWSYFVKLEEARVRSNLVTHRLNKRHIQYTRNKMNVRLAAQTFSRSVSATLKHLMEMGDREFKNSGSTSYFTLQVNDLFDIMNTKSVRRSESMFKSALNIENADSTFEFFDQTKEYLSSLKFNRMHCIDSRRKTGFVGMILNMVSVKALYEEYVLSGILSSLPTFYITQDPLESFFSRVRSLHGCNDNPTVQQLKSAVRKLLFLNEITSSELANCEDNLNVLTVTSAKINRLPLLEDQNSIDFIDFQESEDDEAINVANWAIETEEFMQDLGTVKSKEDATIAFFAGSVERRIESSRMDCAFCQNVFKENDKIDGTFVENPKAPRPCKSTFFICKCTHEIFDKGRMHPQFNYSIILSSIKRAISNQNLFSQSKFDHEEGEFHKECYIDGIIDEYVRIYGTYIARCLTLEQQQLMLRSRNKRTTIFSGQ